MALMVVIELDTGRGTKVEGDIGSISLRADPVVFVPAVIEGGLILKATGRDTKNALPYVVASVVSQMSGGALWLPIARATKLTLHAASDGDAGWVRGVVSAHAQGLCLPSEEKQNEAQE